MINRIHAAVITAALAAGLGLGLAACGSTAAPAVTRTAVPSPAITQAIPPGVAAPSVTARPKPAPTVTVTARPKPAKTVYVQPAAQAPAQQFTNAVSVVDQFYQDITDHAYAAAWALGGRYIGGQSYSSWVAGYATTASITLYDTAEFGSGQVTAYLSAVQSDGSTRTYYGTYTVTGGVITGADIVQSS